MVAALIAHGIATSAGASAETFIIEEIPMFRVETAVMISVLAIICAVVSIVFCVMLHQSEYFFKKIFKNP